MKKTFIYTRHFTYRSYEKNTATQLCDCIQKAEQNHMQVICTYSDTSSEKLKTYPMFKKMKKDCKKLKPDAIIIYSMSTLGRDLNYIKNFQLSMKKKGIKIIYATSANLYENELIKFLLINSLENQNEEQK